MILLLLNKTTPHFQLLPMSKVDQSFLRIHEVPPFTVSKKSYNILGQVWYLIVSIPDLCTLTYLLCCEKMLLELSADFCMLLYYLSVDDDAK